MIDEPTKTDWPVIQFWELDDFFRTLRAGVIALEEAFQQRRLAVAIEDTAVTESVGPDIAETYVRLAQNPDEPHALLRQETVHGLLDQAREEIFNIHQWCDARAAACRVLVGDPPSGREPGEARAIRLAAARVGGGPEEFLRLDQLISSRFWGIGFHFEDPDDTNYVARLVAARTASRLARDLRHLHKVLRRFRPLDPNARPRMVPRPEERGFEQLMLDILNEERRCARPAPLSEDFLEKTDIRVRYPGLDRRRGGRVQVTQITDTARHEEKLSKIRKLDQFVILSPLTLARFINREVHQDNDKDRVLQHFDLDAFWRCLPNQPTDIDQLAYTIKRLLLEPLRSPRRNPRGPVALVPWALKQIIRIFVRHDTFRATERLREHERNDPKNGH